MGINPSALNDKQRAMIDPRDRKRDKRLRSQGDAQQRYCTRLERKIHDQFTSFCKRHDIIYWHSSPVHKSSIMTGLPDYLCLYNNIAIAIEFKIPPNKLTKEQERVFSAIENAGNRRVLICEETRPGAAYSTATRFLIAAYGLIEDAAARELTVKTMRDERAIEPENPIHKERASTQQHGKNP
jgi:hypothetical protein